MSILGHILSAPLTGPLDGLLWLARTIESQAKGELYDQDKIRGALAELELRLDLGEIDIEAYEAEEEVLLQLLKEIREAEKNA